MNHSELRERLTRITPREERCRRGMASARDLPFTERVVNGRRAPYIAILDTFDSDAIGAGLTIKQHGRFQDFPEHCHDCIELNYMYAGSSTQIVNGTEYRLEQGQVLLMSADTVHTIAPLGEGDILLNCNLNTNYLITGFLNRFSCDSVLTRFLTNALGNSIRHDDFLFFRSEGSERLQRYMEDMLCEWFEPSVVARDVISNLFSLVLSELVVVYESQILGDEHHADIASVLPIMAYIERNFLTCTLDEVAQRFGLNPNYLSNLLKRRCGLSYREMVQMQKLSCAERLLVASNAPVTEVARLSGYENVSFFYKKFKEKNGCLPAEYRARRR